MKQDYNKLFDKITPQGSDEEFLVKVLRKAENMENKKSISIKRPIIAVAAAISVLSLGVVTATAAGLINFNTIFGRQIKVETEELGAALIGNAENISYSVSDGYEIKLNGITGDKEIIFANLEIFRTDGTAINDHFLIPYSDDDRIYAVSEETVDFPQSLFQRLGGDGSYRINESGNLEINYELHSKVDINGKRIKIQGSTLYNDDIIWEKIKGKNCRFYKGIENGEAIFVFSNYLLDENGNMTSEVEDVELDITDAIYLPIHWSVEFDYVPSDKSVEAINRSYFTVDDNIMFVTDIDENGEYTEREFEILNINLKSTGGELELRGELDADYYLEDGHNPMVLLDKANRIKIINNDGTETDAFFMSGATNNMGHADGRSYTKYKIAYTTGDFETHLKNETLFENCIAIDLSNVKAISFNGREYKLHDYK